MSKIEQGIDPTIKKAINEEGYEGDTEGGAAVIIGKKEGGEMDRLRENLENEGRCTDAATYIKLNKQIFLPAEKVPEGIKAQRGKAWIGSSELKFVDREGNIARVNINYGKIASIPTGRGWERDRDYLINELGKHGFRFDPEGFLSASWASLNPILREYEREVEEQTKNQKKEEFNF